MNVDASRPTIALFPWGDVVEEFLDPIGLCVEDFVERMTGGWLFGYVAALQETGYRPVIVCASERTDRIVRYRHSGTGASIWMVPGRRAVQGRTPAVYSVRRWLATPKQSFREVLIQERCRAVIVQEYEYTRFDQLTRLAQALGIPAYATFQGGDRTLSWIEAIVRPAALRRCAGLIIASAAERERVRRSYKAHSPIIDIPNPVDVEEWRPQDRNEARQALGLPQDAFIAINHGRIDIRRKGLDILLRAWAECGGDELVIIGSGQDHDAFEALLAASNLRNVRWLVDYTTDRPLIRRWLSAADVYVTASRIEGMPVAPLEAMACGLPVIATDAQGLPDILADGEASGGLIVPRDEPAALAAAIERIRAEPDLRSRLGRAGRQRIIERFSIAAAGTALADMLRCVDADPARAG